MTKLKKIDLSAFYEYTIRAANWLLPRVEQAIAEKIEVADT